MVLGMSVGESDADLLASDFCDAPTDTTLLVDNWQPLPAAKQPETDTLTCCCYCLFTFSKRTWSMFLSNKLIKHVILERKGG